MFQKQRHIYAQTSHKKYGSEDIACTHLLFAVVLVSKGIQQNDPKSTCSHARICLCFIENFFDHSYVFSVFVGVG